MNEKTQQQTYTLLIDLTGLSLPDAHTLADSIERWLESRVGIGSALVSGVEGDATHASAVLAALFMHHKHKH